MSNSIYLMFSALNEVIQVDLLEHIIERSKSLWLAVIADSIYVGSLLWETKLKFCTRSVSSHLCPRLLAQSSLFIQEKCWHY